MVKKSLPQDSKPKRRRRRLPPNVFERDGHWYVKIRWRCKGCDRHKLGGRHNAVRKCAKNPTDAKEVREALQLELKQQGSEAMRQNRHTFGELAGYYDLNYLVEARYVEDRKVSGRRSTSTPKSQLKYLRRIVGDGTALRKIDYLFVRGVRIAMIEDPVVILTWQKDEDGKLEKRPTTRQRSIADVNRKMSLLRHMIRIALWKKWIIEDPFLRAPKTLITPGDEKKRRRVMSIDEENALLACCDEERDYLRLLIIGLAYTLTRSESEFFKLRVRDLDFEGGRTNVQQMNTKTLREREAPLPRIFCDEARAYIEKHGLAPDDRLFPYTTVKRSWKTLKRKAGVDDLRIKDLRRTAATRLHRAGMPLGELMLLLGHTTIEMTREYIGVDRDTTGRANELLDGMHAERVKEASESVN